ncbi:hypothetical protein [Parvicella tangerina]|uniref:Uncharacterized protein n=1 Tax=Parvicella tangerina TaxID=2829795 RepID=A0A916JQQ7_9FLAO|nr:hypothetical protein [Parvicella tangerina]CAG5086760.1 hypothetical protein CRYO30217_03268 [Parvicella tangerina]
MEDSNYILSRVDTAFSEVLEQIGKRKGKPKKNVCIRIRFVGEQKAMELGLFTFKSIVRLDYLELSSQKLTALRFGIEEFYGCIKAFYQMTKQKFKVGSKEDVAVLFYESSKSKRPVVVGAVNGKLKQCMYVSDLLAILGTGDELLN